jgi:hypothetical protein
MPPWVEVIASTSGKTTTTQHEWCTEARQWTSESYRGQGRRQVLGNRVPMAQQRHSVTVSCLTDSFIGSWRLAPSIKASEGSAIIIRARRRVKQTREPMQHIESELCIVRSDR